MTRLLYHSLALYLTLTPPSSAASARETATPDPCTIRSPNTNAFFDLNPLHIVDPEVSKAKHPRDYSWNTTGYDLNYNFTVNFCGPVVEGIEDVVGVEKAAWGEVAGFYRQGGKVFSIGQQNSVPVFRGRKLVLNYTNGSPCDPTDVKQAHLVQDLATRALLDDDDDDYPTSSSTSGLPAPTRTPSTSPIRRKNTIISFLCDKDPLAPLLALSFIGASPDECTYIFEARSSAGCGGIETAKQTLSPSGVFGVIVIIAIVVYVVGGCVYSRVVLQQRGWRQLPNYALWSGVGSFFRDIFIILTSSCTRFLPSRRGYTRVNGYANGAGSGSGRGWGRGRVDSDAENRLIDELNEEWDD